MTTTYEEFQQRMPTFEAAGYRDYGDGSLDAFMFSPSAQALGRICQLACDDVPDSPARKTAWLVKIQDLQATADWIEIRGTRWEAALLRSMGRIAAACGARSLAIGFYRDAIHVGYGGDGMGAWVAVQRLEELGEDPWA